jgi:hypothetical protein
VVGAVLPTYFDSTAFTHRPEPVPRDFSLKILVRPLQAHAVAYTLVMLKLLFTAQTNRQSERIRAGGCHQQRRGLRLALLRPQHDQHHLGKGHGQTKSLSTRLAKRLYTTADPTGFEPAISALTGPHVRPLHHGSNTLSRAGEIIPEPRLFVNYKIRLTVPDCPSAPIHRPRRDH